MKNSKNYLFRLPKFDSVLSKEEDDSKCILLNPNHIKNEEDIASVMGIDLEKIGGTYSRTDVTVNYKNWKADQILKSVLPENVEGCASFSIIGHILHLNLREHLYPYKFLIAQVYLDKISNISLVVNKVDIVDNSDNTFRSFSMEKLAGETNDTVATVKENNCTFTFDFSKVYWNPRLSTEHERIVHKLKKRDLLFDVMAGVGPFAIPAAKKNCSVFANDLNPLSYEALKENCTLNKVADRVKCFNMDGNDFIKEIVKLNLKDVLNNQICNKIHITMNLPSIAIDFLPSFIDLYDSENAPNFNISEENDKDHLPILHTYLFSYNETKEFVVHSIASKLGYCISEIDLSKFKEIDTEVIKNNIKSEFWQYIIEVVNVRRVAPAKVMFRASFYLPLEVLIQKNSTSMSELTGASSLPIINLVQKNLEVDGNCISSKRLRVE